MIKEILSQYTFVQNQAVQWGEMDAFQHVNNTVYFRYFENARIGYFDLSGINQYMSEHKIGPILGSTDCRFLAPLSYPDNIFVATRVSVMRDKRFTMNYSVCSEKQQREVASGNGEIIYFDYQTQRTCEIPNSILEKINKLENSALTP